MGSIHTNSEVGDHAEGQRLMVAALGCGEALALPVSARRGLGSDQESGR